MIFEEQILVYKSKSYVLYRELKKLEADYQKLIDICTKLELELENMINSIEAQLNTQRKDIVRIILDNNELKRKIEEYRMGNRLEYSEIEDPQASSTPLKANKLTDFHQKKFDKLTEGIQELKTDFDVVQEAFRRGESILEYELPQKIRAQFDSILELLHTSIPGKDRDQMIQLVHLLNVSQVVYY